MRINVGVRVGEIFIIIISREVVVVVVVVAVVVAATTTCLRCKNEKKKNIWLPGTRVNDFLQGQFLLARGQRRLFFLLLNDFHSF